MLRGFATSGKAASNASCLAMLPIELTCMIVEILKPVDRIALALAAKYFAQLVLLKDTTIERSSEPTYGSARDIVEVYWDDLLCRLSRDWMPRAYHVCRGKDSTIFRPTFCPDWLKDLQAGRQARERTIMHWICTSCWCNKLFSEEQLLEIETEKLKAVQKLVLKQEAVVENLRKKQTASRIMQDRQAAAFERGKSLEPTLLVTLKLRK